MRNLCAMLGDKSKEKMEQRKGFWSASNRDAGPCGLYSELSAKEIKISVLLL